MTAERAVSGRVNRRTETGTRHAVYGTVRAVPERYARKMGLTSVYAVPRGSAAKTQTAGNRARALMTGRGYVVFLALISLLTVFMCVYYLRLKATILTQISDNEKLEAQLVSMRSENDALLENVNNSVDWEAVRDVAINKLGMKYATEDQIVWYNTDDSSYIKQYEDVPS